MNRILRFYRLPDSEQHLLMVALILGAAIRIALWILPFRVVRTMIFEWSDASAVPYQTNRRIIETIAWSVETSSRFIPSATCLVQALVTKVLLDRRGVSNDLRIGVAKEEGGRLEAHAWIEYQGEIVLGAVEDLARFTEFPSLGKIGM
ncbi:MAG: lasso peptide biosynthesis B2 protein [Candidatus Latescibacteria bacterium]|jgi:hypothetical protein|nr:lasso peptide biosynthesis B2 protein [Candidatus Latescibacterota bacterium]